MLKMKLLDKISIIVILAMLAAIICAGVINYYGAKGAVSSYVTQAHLETARQVFDRIDRLLYERTLDVQSIADSTTLSNYSAGRIDKEAALERFSGYLRNTGPWDSLIVLNKNGLILISDKKDMEGENINNLDYPHNYFAFEQAIAGKAYYSDLVLSKITGNPTIIFASPLRDTVLPDKPIIGAVIGQFSWPVILEILSNNDSETYLYNQDGLVIGAGDEEHYKDILEESIANTELFNRMKKFEFGATLLGSVHGDYQSLTGYATEEGYLSFRGNNWLVTVETPESMVFASSMSAALSGSFFLVPFGIVALILILLFISYYILKPIKNLALVAKQITEGDLSRRAEIGQIDEIGTLAVAFNAMTDKLMKHQTGLEKKIKTRTLELEKKNKLLGKNKLAMLDLMETINNEKENLVRDKAKDEAILSGIGDGVFVLDLDRRIVLFNPAAEKISGFSAEEAIGQKYDKVLKFIFEKDGSLNNKFVNEAMTKGKIAQMSNHTQLIKKDGDKVPVADSTAPIKNAKGRIIGCVVVFRDVTKERRIEQMKSEFVSVASHQLRTPLTGIKWFAELLMKTKISAMAKDYVKEIAFSNERMVRLVDDLLNVSRIETGRKFDIVKKDVDIVPLVKSVIEEQMPSAKAKNISLSCSTSAPRELIMSVDELKMRQVFQNLVSNAIKYSKEKTNIELGYEQGVDEVAFYVKDGGVGIPKHQQNQIFKKFFRAENVVTMHTDGTGLGLYIVKAIVEAHGGKIWFESEENKGTTFHFTFPRKFFK